MPSSDATANPPAPRGLTARLVWFCLPLVVVALALEWLLAGLPTSYTTKHEQLHRLAPEIETLVLGSSGAYYDVAATQLPGTAYNLANVSETMYYHDALLTRVLPELPKLRRVILGVGYLSLHGHLGGGHPEEWRQYYYFQEWGIAPRALRERWDVRMLSRLALYSSIGAWPYLQQSLRARSGAVNPIKEIDRAGSWQAQGSSDLGPAAAAATLRLHHQAMQAANLAENYRALDHLLGLLRARNIDVAIVVLPVSPSYAQGMNPVVWREATGLYRQLAAKWSVQYLDFLQTPALTAADFHDPDHLNAGGAVRFTQLLGEALPKR